MTDDPHEPAADAGATAGFGSESGVAAAAPDSGSDRRKMVYLVPSVSGETDVSDTESDSSGATTATAQRDVADRDGAVVGGTPTGEASEFDQDQNLPAAQAEREDWAWVQEWRDGQEPTPWATGIALAVFSALIVGVAVWVLSAGLADQPVIAVLVNLLVAAGLTPAIWLSRGLPVLRWIAAGAVVGIVVGWVSAILMLPYPTA